MTAERTPNDTGKDRESGYVTGHIDIPEYDGRYGEVLNLGLAASPIGASPEVKRELIRVNDLGSLEVYNPDVRHHKTKRTIIDALDLDGAVDERCLEFNGNGSYGAGDEIVRMYSRLGYDEILVPTYSFPNVAQYAARHGLKYTPVEGKNLSPLAAQEEMAEMGGELAGKVVYVDYPNNPFGAADPQTLRRVADVAYENGAGLMVDMAFGEVLGDEYADAIKYTVSRDGVALTSLSKTQGLPSLRVGLSIVSPELVDRTYDGGQRLVFGLNDQARRSYDLLYSQNGHGTTEARRHADHVANYCTAANQKIREHCEGSNIVVMRSNDRVPVQVLRARDGSNLYQALRLKGILTESLDDYEVTTTGSGYGDNAVRLLTPSPDQLDDMLKRIEDLR